MKWWMYKCNSRNLPHQRAYGDWRDFFDMGKEQHWGTTDWIPALADLNVGDLIIAYQTNRNELAGLAKVTQTSQKDGYIYLKPLESINVRVRPLKKANPNIASIQALQPGPIKTIYPISDTDARQLLKAARSTYRIISTRPNQKHENRKSGACSPGGGFGNGENNAEVESAAIEFVKQYYYQEGWDVDSVERDRCGFDLRCKKNKCVLEVEVKGVKGTTKECIITAGEVSHAANSPKSVVCVVNAATSDAPKLSIYTGKEFFKKFTLDPIQFRARLKS